MRRVHLLLVVPLIALLGAKALASGPEPARSAITQAALAPFQALLDRDGAALCASLEPSVASGLVRGTSSAAECPAAAAHVLLATAANEPSRPVEATLKPSVEQLEVKGARATIELSFIWMTTTRKSAGTSVTAIHHSGLIELELEEAGGVWLVSSPARLATIPGCRLAKPRRCHSGSRVLFASIGVVLPLQKLPIGIELPSPGTAESPEYEAGKREVARDGCLACHKIGDNGNPGPGKDLTHIGSKLSERQIARALVDSPAPMPSFRGLSAHKRDVIVKFLAALK